MNVISFSDVVVSSKAVSGGVIDVKLISSANYLDFNTLLLVDGVKSGSGSKYQIDAEQTVSSSKLRLDTDKKADNPTSTYGTGAAACAEIKFTWVLGKRL